MLGFLGCNFIVLGATLFHVSAGIPWFFIGSLTLLFLSVMRGFGQE